LTGGLIFHFLVFGACTSDVLYHSCFLWDWMWEGCIMVAVIRWLLFSDGTEVSVGN